MTQIAGKKEFLAWLDREIDDNAGVVLTHEIIGQLKSVPKRNTKEISFAYAADAFSDPQSIGHFALRKTPVFSFCIVAESDLSEIALQKLEKSKQFTVESNPATA